MAASQKFCLKWNNFQNSVTSVFENLRQDEELVDITLCCEGQKIKAHRMMLSACSPYFRDLLKENPCQHPVFFLKDTSYPDLAAVVEFVYKGEVNVLQSQLGSFLKTAEMLQVKGLSGDDDDEQPGRTPPAPAERAERPRLNSAQPPAASPLRGKAREPPDGPASPRSKRRRLSGSGSRPASPVPVQMVSSAPPAPPAPLPLPLSVADAAGGEAAPAAAAAPVSSALPGEPALDHRPHLQQHAPPPPPTAQQPPQQQQQQQHDDYIKVEKIDIADEDDDESLEATLGQVTNFEASQFEGSDHSASSHDIPGLISRVSEQGGSGDLTMAGAAPTSEDGSSQGGGRRSVPAGQLHVCSLCGKAFRAASSLSHHTAVHRGLTTCPICGRVCSRRPDLLQHMRMLHGVQNP